MRKGTSATVHPAVDKNRTEYSPRLFPSLLILLIICVAGCAVLQPPVPDKDIIKVTGQAKVNFPSQRQKTEPEKPFINEGSWAKGSLEAVGSASRKPGVSDGQALLLAKAEARQKALQALAEKIAGIEIAPGVSFRDLMKNNDVLRDKCDRLVKSAEVVKESMASDGNHETVVRLPLAPFGELVSIVHTPIEPPPSVQTADLDPGELERLRNEAEEHALENAHRNLLVALLDYRINGEFSVREFLSVGDNEAKKVLELVRSADVIRKKYYPDGTVEIDVEFDRSRLKPLLE